MEEQLTKLWYRDDAGPSLLQPLGWLYQAAMRLRRSSYTRGLLARHRVGKPVIVVGNLTVGGTGKTPLVIWLARKLTARGLKVGIVSRGYGAAAGETPRTWQAARPRRVDTQSDWREVGDEPLLLYRGTGCTTVVGRDRVAAARVLVAEGVDVIIADDGLQHLRLARECEIVVIDGARGFGNGRMLPAGPLREPASRVSNADIVVINGPAEHASLRRLGVQIEPGAWQMALLPAEAVRLDGQGAARPLDSFRGAPVHAVAGIGNPERFFRELRARGLDVIEHAFGDHHPFTPPDLSFGDAHPVLMTGKDAVKCTSFAQPAWWSVPVAATFGETQERALLERVLRKIGSANVGG